MTAAPFSQRLRIRLILVLIDIFGWGFILDVDGRRGRFVERVILCLWLRNIVIGGERNIMSRTRDSRVSHVFEAGKV